MPPLELRGRYLMREYWGDADLHRRLSADQRELLVGLWMLADDEGFLPRDIGEISAALYRFEDIAPRERRVRAGLDRLRELAKVQSHRCGCLFVPAVVRYPRAGKKSTEHWAVHQKHSNRFGVLSSKPQTDLNRFEPIQTDLNPSPVPSLPDPSRPARAQGETEKNGMTSIADAMAEVPKYNPHDRRARQ